MAYNTTASLEKLTCTDYVDFGKCQNRFGRTSWCKNDPNYLDIKLKVFRREEKNEELQLRQNFSGRSSFQSVYSTRKSTSSCSRQFSQRTKFAASFWIYTIQRHGGATEPCSQNDWRCGLSKQKVLCNTSAIQGGQPRNLLGSSSSIWTEDGGRKSSATCVYQL